MVHNSSSSFWLLAGFGGGLITFFRGFQVYRECRVVEDTPQIPIRSIPMGLVSIRGKATGEERVTSPVSHTPCYFYKVDIERWKQDSHGSRWEHYRTDTGGVRFYLDDGSGKVLVNSREAELDLTVTCEREVAGEAGASELGALLVETLVNPLGGAVHSGPVPSFLGDMIKKRLVSSQAANNPAQLQARQATLEALKYPVGSAEFVERFRRALSQAPGAADDERKFLAWAGSARQDSPEFLPSGGRFRLKEFCIVPGLGYNVIGTCVENPAAQDEHDRNLIVKGANEPTYLISDKALGTVESSLRWRALLMVAGGAALAVFCLGFLLSELRLF